MASREDNGQVTLPQRQRSARRAVLALLPILLAAVLAWGYALYDLLLSPSSISGTMGPQENHYWTVARFQISALLAEQQVLRYERGTEPDFDAVSKRFDVLKSRYFVIADRSDAADMLAGLQAFRPTMSRLGQDLSRMSALLPALANNRSAAEQLLPLFEDVRQVSDQLAREIGNAEVADRDRVYNDFVRKRQNLFIASAGVGVAATVLIVLAALYERRRRAFSAQQAATIEAEQRANRAAADAILAKNAFLGAVGHELRTPLQRITTAIEVLLSTGGHSHNARVMGQLDRAARQLEAQMRDLTDYARLDSGKLSLRVAAFNPTTDVRDAAEDLRSSALQRGVGLEINVAANSRLYVGDATRVRQVVTNLVSNAIKYTNDAGRVSVEAAVEHAEGSAQLFLKVADTGVGIPEDRVEDVFKPFTQLPETSSGKGREGIGMGLAIVRGLVALMGGRIGVASTVGKGTTFSVHLPLVEAPDATSQEVQPTDADRAPRRVLVVDDQEFAREAFRDILAALGLSCAAVGSAGEALVQLALDSYDALILDIEMPGTSGIELAREVRGRPGLNQFAPIIWVSATPPEAHTAPEAAPFQHYLMKPVRVDELERALNATLGH
jgi:signal transduction histidine kinase/ActR/RegA family two-component response regulator